MTTTTAPLCFVDTETTSLRDDRRVWEVGAIRFEPDGRWSVLHHFVADVDLTDADPHSLSIGHFYDRHPRFAPAPTYPATAEEDTQERREVLERWRADVAHSKPEADVARAVEHFTRGAHLVGSNPSFDDAALAGLLHRQGLTRSWDTHHRIDVVQVGMGFLLAKGQPILPPYSSSAVTAALGVAPSTPQERHTALGDVRWTIRLWDALYGTGYTDALDARDAERAAWAAEVFRRDQGAVSAWRDEERDPALA